jgi:CheY-like chemotaxis protein/MinD-like ATPase involved in chromosome partitioning or flagellar assembly
MPENQNLRILLIEDNPGDARLIHEALPPPGDVALEWVDRLAAGLDRIQAGAYDAVLLDLSLPDSRGFETFERLRQRAPRLPVVVLTGLDDEELALRAVRAGAQDYLVKGVLKPGALLRILRFAIERNKVLGRVRGGSSAGSPGKTIAWMGAQGGSGTTSTALNVAAALAGFGKSVVAVELSPYRAGFSLQLRLSPRRDLGEILKLDAGAIGPDELRNCLVRSDFGPGLLFAPQDPRDCPAPEPERVTALLRAATELAEFVVVDLPSAPSPVHAACARFADHFLLVMERETNSLAAGRNLLALVEYWGVDKGSLAAVLVTKDPLSACLSPSQIGAELGIAVAGVIPPAGEALAASSRRGIPLLVSDPDSLPSESLRLLAERLTAPVLTEAL